MTDHHDDRTSAASSFGPSEGPSEGPPDLAALRRRLAEFAAARDWQPYHTPKNLVAALSVEASELVEIFQWLTPEESARVMADPATAYRVRDEVADVLAYLLQLCEVLDVDPLAALAAKIDRNERRFPVAGGAAEPTGPGEPTGPRESDAP
ncbi:nucleotide pyrophosphohydrolase [Streptomyces similanensis]|uniref:Nucleotide pyrophosphohydrolase n=1 Tax=Streptomyces similanensis TaxID=1274988 RepID=A0ABP9JWQ1_9ACTN